jgi:acyl-CoA dehydrogenase
VLANAPIRSAYYSESHEAFRASLRRFVEREIAPFVDEWDEAGRFPRELYRRAADVGLLGIGFPEEFGGVPGDEFFSIIAVQELARAACGGVSAGLMSHTIGLPPIARLGSEELKRRVLPPVLAGDKISALAITEPDAGSDVANIRTKAERRGDHFVVDGAKMFITSGVRADFYTVAVRTGGAGKGGISLLLVERGASGFSQTELKKMGWWASDTAALHFDGCRVPVQNLIGEENSGFSAIMLNFNSERLAMAAGANGFSQVCYDEAVAWARGRNAFGKRLVDQQVIRHKLVDMAMRINATQAYLEALAWRIQMGDNPVAEIAMLKNQATQTMAFCAAEAVQIHGGMGFMRGTKVERIYREVKVNAIGGGAEEIMKELAARQLGL